MGGPCRGQPIAYAQQLWSVVRKTRHVGTAFARFHCDGRYQGAAYAIQGVTIVMTSIKLCNACSPCAVARRRRVAAECSDGNQVLVGLEV